jgi:hypothetical protein
LGCKKSIGLSREFIKDFFKIFNGKFGTIQSAKISELFAALG